MQWCKQDILCCFGHLVSHAAACTCRGITANVVLLIYYSAPLTTVKEVLVSRSSASLYWPLCMMNVLNGLLWVGYGRVSNVVLRSACACSFLSACMCQAHDGWLFLWVTGNLSNGQYQCTAEQENHTGPAGCILTLPHNVLCGLWGIGQNWQALFGLFMPSVFKSCTQTAPIGLICTWCTAVVAFLGQYTRTIASEYTVSISSQKSTSHASAKQQVGSLALCPQLWQTPSI